MVSTPEILGIYPVVEVGSLLKVAIKTSEVNTLADATVMTEAQVPEEIDDVPNDTDPLPIVCVLLF